MEPIVSPWFIYLLSIVSGVKNTFLFFVLLSGLVVAICLIIKVCLYIDETEFNNPENTRKSVRAVSKLAYPLFIISLLGTIFIPNKNALIGMYVANEITPDNITKAVEIGKDFKESVKKDVLDIIQSITNAREKQEE